LDDQVWLQINAGMQMDVSALLPVPDRRKVMKAVVDAHKDASGRHEFKPEELAQTRSLGIAKLRG
jgi:hypothetical protein